MNILLTGGLGFTGSAVIRSLISTTDHVAVNVDQETNAASHEALEEAGRDRRHVDIRADICDAEAMRAAFATWRARHDFESGLAATPRWYLDHEAWWGPARARRCAGQRLGQAPGGSRGGGRGGFRQDELIRSRSGLAR